MTEENLNPETPAPAAPATPLQDWYNNFRQFYTESIVGIMLGNLTKAALIVFATILIYKSFFAPRIVSVDVAGILDDQVRKAVQHPMSEQERQQNAALFTRSLESALDHLGADNRNIVLVKPAVVRGAVDMTADVQQYINNLMMSTK
jgi:type-F conjugative transfer system protein TrbI